LTKAEREAEALQRRKEEVERKQKELKDLEKQRNKFLSDARKSDRDRRDRDYRRDRDRRSRSRSRTRSKEREERRNERIAEKDRERMQEAIKTRYLGIFNFIFFKEKILPGFLLIVRAGTSFGQALVLVFSLIFCFLKSFFF